MPDETTPSQLETATLGGGCFWCSEAVFGALQGVTSVISGYAGGHTDGPTYQEVCSGSTGHAEVVQVTFEASLVSYLEVLEVFFATHDPTTLNQQGADVGTQYRSVVLAHGEAQAEVARALIASLTAERLFDRPIVTEVVPFERFWPAEAYHQGYFARNPQQPYCAAVVSPKLAKFRARFRDRLKAGSPA
ncbi:MAG: peptide-methionine (S)-S-oxide reductase MsrA [Candidatus Sericytochromatia bacterium]|nr:peptide-methionine (S)-S-oxide reductase MsrA [Candidatus Sericytochromatia bacterium]